MCFKWLLDQSSMFSLKRRPRAGLGMGLFFFSSSLRFTKRSRISSKQWKKTSPQFSFLSLGSPFLSLVFLRFLRRMRLSRTLEGFFLRFGRLMLRTLCLLLGGEGCGWSFSIEVSRCLDIFLSSAPSSRFSSWLLTSFSFSSSRSSSRRSRISPIWNSTVDLIPLSRTVKQITSASFTSRSNSDSAGFFSFSSPPSPPSPYDPDQSSSSSRYTNLPISCSVKPALASRFRKICATLKLRRQISRKPSFSRRVVQSRRGSMASMNCRDCWERGISACLQPIQTIWWSQISKLSGKERPWSMGMREVRREVAPLLLVTSFLTTRMLASLRSQLSTRRSRMAILCTSFTSNCRAPRLPTMSMYSTNSCSEPCLVRSRLRSHSGCETMGLLQTSRQLKQGWQNSTQAVAGTSWKCFSESSRYAATSRVAHSPLRMPFRMPSPPSSPANPRGLFGVQGSSSKGLYTPTTFFWLFSRKQVPEVPSAARRGRLPALRPDWTLRTRFVISGGVFSKIWQGLMTPFWRLWALALAMMTMVEPASILQKSKKLRFSSVSSMFLQKRRMSCSVRCVCLSLNFSFTSSFLSSAVRIQGKNLSLNFRPLKILSSKLTSIFSTCRFDSVFMSPGPESIRLQLIDSTRTNRVALQRITYHPRARAPPPPSRRFAQAPLPPTACRAARPLATGGGGGAVALNAHALFRYYFLVYLIMLRRLLLGGAVCGGLLGTGERESECCGIVGMVMKAPITREQQAKMGRANYRYTLEEFLCEGVELLKNRGYDSAGVFTLSAATQAGRLVKYAEHGLKQAGCINKVVEEVMQETGVATSGIAHTRWATCGEKVDRNSHPHFDEGNQIYLVHNGIITNHASIKNEYLPDVKFTSSTDTEVIVQFLALRRRQGSSMLQALEEFRSKAGEKSQWGLVIIDRTAPDTIYTATNGSPLLIGFSAEEDEILVVSERIAFEKHVNCYFPSYDHEVFELKVTEIPQLKERMRERLFHITEPQKVELRPPAQFSHWYNYEIRQQAEIPFVADFERVKAIEFGDFLTMLACGSSYYAACAGEYFFKRLRCFRKVNIVDPVEMEPSDITENETVVLISQSGETKDLISIVGDCKQRASVKTIGIINVEGSTLARKVDFPIYIKVGREVCVAATKSFFHQVLNVIRFATEVAEQKKSAPLAEIEQIRASLALAPQKVREIIERNEAKCEELAQLLRGRESLYLLGKRESMAIAKEAALKIKELNYIHAEALGACEMKHGPIALIESDRKQETAVILFVLRNETFTVMMNALDQMDSRNAFVVVITDCEEEIEQQHKKEVEKIEKENEKLPEADRRPHPTRKYHFILTIPHLPHASHLLAIIPIQLFVEKMCPLRGGIDPDHPRNLAKSVTV